MLPDDCAELRAPLLHFTKMCGAGNDFVMIDNRDGALQLDRSAIARLCGRHRRIGADGLLMVEPAEQGADFRMRYDNANGVEAEMSGSGARCFGRFAGPLSRKTDQVSFEAMAGASRRGRLGTDKLETSHGSGGHPASLWFFNRSSVPIGSAQRCQKATASGHGRGEPQSL